MVLVIGQNSSWQNTYVMPRLDLGRVNRADKICRSAAGKGANMVRCLGILGIESHLLGYAGGAVGEKFVGACDEDRIPSTFVTIEAETRMCTSLILPGGETTEVIEPAPVASERKREELRDQVKQHLTGATMLAIGGTAVQGEPEGTYRDFVQAAKDKGIPVFLDSYRLHGKKALEASPDVLKINTFELADLSGAESESVEQRFAACKAIRERYGVKWIIITRGREGAEAYAETGFYSAFAPRVPVVNPIGSGDAFSAGVIALVDQHGTSSKSLPKALIKGVAMGTANCMTLKPGSVELSDLDLVEKSVSIE